MNKITSNHAVFTLAEAAKFLRVKTSVLQKLAEQGRVPARKVGAAWRFSRPGLEKWLRGGIDPDIALLQQAGLFKEDPDLLPMLTDIYEARGRPEFQED
jgi:excisionase family DNA binding protein